MATKNESQSTSQSKKISNYITMIVLIVLALSIAALILAVGNYTTGLSETGAPQAGYFLSAGVFAVIGLIALIMSVFTLYQSRRQTAEMKIETPKVMTTIQCTSKICDFKTIREFQRGDFVFKELDVPCQKCSGRQMITAIYKEVKEKEKTYSV
jgi:Na+/melibiose symporter-like transporter